MTTTQESLVWHKSTVDSGRFCFLDHEGLTKITELPATTAVAPLYVLTRFSDQGRYKVTETATYRTLAEALDAAAVAPLAHPESTTPSPKGTQ